MTYYIKENFYFDIDKLNQFRITGPQNHLLIGLSFPENFKVYVKDYDIDKGQLVVTLEATQKKLRTTIPIVSDIRTLRTLTENVRPFVTYSELIQKNIHDITPQIIKKIKTKKDFILKFVNSYTDEQGKKRTYGSKIIVSDTYEVALSDTTLSITGKEPIVFTIKTISNIRVAQMLRRAIFNSEEHALAKVVPAEIVLQYQRSKENIEYLIRTQKTSSFEYGTIFPRDWIESADLGATDLTNQTIDYMYLQAMKNISETGEGWHEDIVGAYRTKISSKDFIDRKMIDIEPRYLLGMEFVTKKFLFEKENKRRLRLVAQYVLRNAEEKELITFKRLHPRKEEYYSVGNWRDSENAFPGQKSPLAPYDVNCVFYPCALKIIRKYHDFFEIKNSQWLDELIDKWGKNKQKFRLYHPYDMIGYALALHGEKNKPLAVSHLDESYDLFYGTPSLEEIYCFAVKLTDPDFFFTPVGPLLIANDEEYLTHGDYHGKVIWPKQAAFAIAGLVRQYKKGLSENYPENLMDTIKTSVIKTSEACFAGWEDLDAIPELYYYDEHLGKARFFTDQEEYTGQMSMVQLWSSVGARRIIRDYQFIKNN